MRGKTDGKPVNRAGRMTTADEPWLGSYWSLAVFVAAEIAIGSLAVRFASPSPHANVSASAGTAQAGHLHPAVPPPAPGSPLQQVAHWAAMGDAGGRPYVIIDKAAARVIVFDAQGRPVHSVPALLGSALGDDSTPGIGDKPLSQIKPEERITPAGRFVAQLGENLNGEDIVWIDYDTALSMHRVRKVKESERRFERLASETSGDNRISNGCINLPVAFYEQVLKPLVEAGPTVVYVLPEQRALHEVFALGASGKPTQARRQPVL
jgi:hypothetical protein